MSIRTKILGSALTAAVMLCASAASATVIIKAIPGGPFTAADLPLTVPALMLSKSNTYDFTFTLADPLPSSLAGQVAAQLATHVGSTPEEIQFSVYEGTPTKSNPEAGLLLGTSDYALSPTVSFDIAPGSYYINIVPSGIAKSGETISGSVTSAVPEPATWGVMLVGFGAIGSSMRNARRRKLAATA